jgi:hypothetical protein
MQKDLDSEQINHLWEHRRHVDIQFYSRMNFFLVFESVLLGVVGVMYSKPATPSLILKGIIVLGLILTLIWEYSQARHKYILDDLTTLVKEVMPEYEQVIERRRKAKWPISNRTLSAYVVPSLIALLWIIFLFFL